MRLFVYPGILKSTNVGIRCGKAMVYAKMRFMAETGGASRVGQQRTRLFKASRSYYIPADSSSDIRVGDLFGLSDRDFVTLRGVP